MDLRHVLMLIFGFMVGTSAFGQRFGGNPAGKKWWQINNAAVRVIYPAGLDSQAAEIAALALELRQQTTSTLGTKHKKIDIVLQNEPVISNGYVGLAPYRSEFYMNPPTGNFELGSLPWHKQLALHEFRHAQQYANFNKGLSRLGAVILGQEGQALVNAMAVPDWFFEGDAVFQETSWSEQGRGRIPAFFNDYKNLWSTNTRAGWQQLRNGSLKHQYPGHYVLGYMLVAYGRLHYGADFWAKVTDDALRFKGVFYPFQKAVQRQSGKPFPQFTRDALAYFKKETALSTVPLRRERFVSHELFPQPNGEGGYISHYQSYREIPSFRNITDAGERKIRTRDISTDNYFSSRSGRIVYSAFYSDPRWNWKEYSDIILIDTSGKRIRLTHRGRFFSPDINEAGSLIAAVENDRTGHSDLILLDAATGEKHSAFPGQGRVFTYPKFLNDSTVITAVRLVDGRMELAEIQPGAGRYKSLTTPTHAVYGVPSFDENYLYVTQSVGLHDRILRISRTRGETEYLPTSMSYNPVPASGRLLTNRYTLNGWRVEWTDNSNWQKLSAEQYTKTYADAALNQGMGNLYRIRKDSSQPKRYAGLTRPFNLHSWRPYYEDPEWSFTVYGQNVLNTFQTEIAYTYNENEKSNRIGAAAIYGGLFPFIRANADYTIGREVRSSAGMETLDEINAGVGIQIPLQFTGGQYYRNLSLLAAFNAKKIDYTGSSATRYRDYSFNFLRGAISYAAHIQQAVQHIFPRFGYSVQADFRKALGNFSSRQLLASGSLYLPGLAKSHSIVLQGAIQQRDSSSGYIFSNSFPYARGYASYNFYRMEKFGINYHFPIAYPDWGFGQIVYFLRIRPNLFYDYSRIGDNFRYPDGKVRYTRFNQRSTGVELFFDTRWWNQQPISFGLRYARLLDSDFDGRAENRFEFILPIDLF